MLRTLLTNDECCEGGALASDAVQDVIGHETFGVTDSLSVWHESRIYLGPQCGLAGQKLDPRVRRSHNQVSVIGARSRVWNCASRYRAMRSLKSR